MLLFSLLITLIASFIISDNVEAKSFSSVTEYAQYFKNMGMLLLLTVLLFLQTHQLD